MFKSLKTLFRSRSQELWRAWPAFPEGQRVYAIGDIHGRADLLEAMIDKIAKDEAIRPAAETTIVFLGDLIDRGPDSARVVDLVIALARTCKVRAILGNHEEMLLASLESDQTLRRFLEHGGKATILSYFADREAYNRLSISELRQDLRAIIPQDHLAFFKNLEDVVCMGQYVFVHAGIRPGVKLCEQDPHDLRWIREGFLDCDDDLGLIVVHGHTISQDVELRSNRAGVDTGAYLHGKLSALALEGCSRWFLEVTG